MSNYYWVGGNGNWSDYTNHWADDSGTPGVYLNPPGTADDAYFTTSTGSGGAGNVTLDTHGTCRDIGNFGTTPVFLGTNNLNVYGNFSFGSTSELSILQNFTGTVNLIGGN